MSRRRSDLRPEPGVCRVLMMRPIAARSHRCRDGTVTAYPNRQSPRRTSHKRAHQFMVLAPGRMDGGGHEPSPGSDGRRPPTRHGEGRSRKAARNSGTRMPEEGVDRAERQRPVVVVEMVVRVEVDLRPPAGSGSSSRAQRASNPGVVMPEAGLLTPSRLRLGASPWQRRAS